MKPLRPARQYPSKGTNHHEILAVMAHMETFTDLYRILQVHQDAEQDVVEAAYKRLCKKYHPDVCRLPEAEARMKELNVAYETLGDAKKRAQYTLEWRRRKAPAGCAAQGAYGPQTQRAATLQDARRAMERYFFCLSESMYQNAYELLSDADKRNITLASFTEWQRTVGEIYAVRKCAARMTRHIDQFALDDSHSCAAKRFEIEITEENKLTGALSRYTFHKFAVSETDGLWRIYLGYRDLRHLVDQFRGMAGTRASGNKRRASGPSGPSGDAYGLPNRHGFLEAAAFEQYRFKRYRRTFAVGALHISAPGGQLSDRAAAHAGQTMRKLLRMIDILGYIDGGRFAVVLAEITKDNAKSVMERLAKRVEQELRANFDVRVSVRYVFRQYAGEEMDSLLTSLCQRLPAPKNARRAN